MRQLELLRHALRSLVRAPLRATLTAVGIAIASGSLVSMVAFAVGMQTQLEAPFASFGLLNQIRVRPPAAEDADEGEDPDGPRLDDAALESFRTLDGVEYAAPDMRMIELEIRHGEISREVRALGIPREAGLLWLVDDLVQAGSFFSLSMEPEALVGSTLAEELGFETPGAAVGAMLTVETARLALDGHEVSLHKSSFEVRICGVFEPPGFAFRIGSRGLLLPIDQMHKVPGLAFRSRLDALRAGEDVGAPSYDRVVVGVTSPSVLPRVERQISALGYEATSVMDELAEARTFFVFLDVLLGAVGTVALIVAGLGILNTLLVTVLERTAEIGVYKAIGASDGDVRILFLSEAATLGFVGGLGGLVLAGVVTALLQVAVNVYAATQDIAGSVDVFRFPLWLLAGSVAFAVLISIASGVYPASRAARVDPIEALRGG